MQKRNITIKNQIISFSILNETAPQFIFFVHGNSNSSLLWKNQLNDKRFSDYCLIAIDLPGHGNSSFAYDTENDYSLLGLARIMSEVISVLSNDNPYILCGFSLGTNIIAEMLSFGLMPKGLILISPCIIGNGIEPHHLNSNSITGEVLFAGDVATFTIKNYFSLALPGNYEQQRTDLKFDYLNTDKSFRSALMTSALKGEYTNEIDQLNRSGLQTLMLIGNNDAIVFPNLYDDKILFSPSTQIIKVEEAGHFLLLEFPEIVNVLVSEFLKEVFKDKI